ncbi:hypothetical protein U9M48_000822 [Paspalum notatum var. saurae]|uniref:Protein kinase domain-containing protein n=1 Tax=Paspalum notatum var. saurae TaxID=547442 RepID=A0AAQ3SCK2_PASNO
MKRADTKSEINFHGRISHPNVVKLLGYSMEDNEQILVYEFMAKGSLEKHLFRTLRGGVVQEALPWSLRLKILIDAASGLAFLHSAGKQIIYRNLKPSKILLDSNFNAKLLDFTLAIHGPDSGESHVSTPLIGTYGYVAPEYVSTGHLSAKSDVYGFGVVLLETMTGLRAVDWNRPSHQMNLVEWARPFLANRRKIGSVMDSRLQGQYRSKGARLATQLTLKCLNGDPTSRPHMDEVVETLKKIGTMESKR